ncbi:MAG: acylphosphatase [Zetaproteobacteria bacterium]|nr:MAG: acylphosphatase [Zetaproteobacteria bacterium]
MRARVHGRVQGVFFRASAASEARRLGVSGWIRNRRDGTVETFAQGLPEAVDAFVDWLHEGPPGASVARVEVEETEPDPALHGFSVRPTE